MTTPGNVPRTNQEENLDPVIKSREYYSGKVVYENTEAKVVGQITVRAPTAAAFNTNVSNILASLWSDFL